MSARRELAACAARRRESDTRVEKQREPAASGVGKDASEKESEGKSG